MAAIRHIEFVWNIFGPPTKGTRQLVAIDAVVLEM